jgi:prolyl-tRNA synthetase
MKDLYTFHANEADLDGWYQKVWQAYLNIFKRCGLDVKVVNSDTGQMGGKSAHEFMVMSEVGEDTIIYCDTCEYAANIEFSNLEAGSKCPHCASGTIHVAKGIEVGNIFKLGTKYSESMNAKFMNEQGIEEPIIMGCYGLGVSRTLMAVVEQHTYENGLIWPKELRPYTYHILVADVTNAVQMDAAEALYQSLSKQSSVLLDDRNERLGSKFQDADLIGSPVLIVFGKLIEEHKVEVHHRVMNKKDVVSLDELDRVLGLQ